MDERTRRLIEAAATIAATGETIYDALDDFLDGLTGGERQAEIDRVWIEPPIGLGEARQVYPELSDDFDVLQGDVIRTSAAFILGVRVPGTYVVTSPTCDTVVRPKPRRDTALLLPVVPWTADRLEGRDDNARRQDHLARLDRHLSFRGTRSLYLPRLPGDEDDILYNLVSFQKHAVVDTRVLPTVERVASMSLVGWRAFNALVRHVLGRTGEEESSFRTAVAEARAA